MRLKRWLKKFVLTSMIMAFYTFFATNVLNLTLEEPAEPVAQIEPENTVMGDEWPPIGW